LNNQSCSIWKSSAAVENRGDGAIIESPRAGGRFSISRTAHAACHHLDEDQKLAVTNWLVSQWRLGIEVPELTSNSLEAAKLNAPLTIAERSERLLRFIANGTKVLGQALEIEDNIDECSAAGWAGVLQWKEVLYLLEMLKEQGYIKIGHPSYAGFAGASEVNRFGRFTATILPAGHIHLEKTLSAAKPEQAFIAMWFDKSMNGAYEDGIRPGVKDAGYEPLRIDFQPHNEKIDDQIVAEIRRSRFVVADFTHGETGMRGGVYYEAGLAHGLGIPVIFSCRDDVIGKVHFDTRQYNHITWSDPSELRQKLADRISATIGDGPRRKT